MRGFKLNINVFSFKNGSSGAVKVDEDNKRYPAQYRSEVVTLNALIQTLPTYQPAWYAP